nr:MAG TPA: hypothetical protein [Caudoviricetes sp.]
MSNLRSSGAGGNVNPTPAPDFWQVTDCIKIESKICAKCQ